VPILSPGAWGPALRTTRCALAVLVCLGAVAAAAAAQSPCPPRADSLVNAGWTHYRANEMDAAGSAFAAARASCPSHLGALIGTGYVALRRGNVAEAAMARRRCAQRSRRCATSPRRARASDGARPWPTPLEYGSDSYVMYLALK
jgi:hypothetical protein